MKIVPAICSFAVFCLTASTQLCGQTLKVGRNVLWLDGKRADILFRDSGDLDGDRRRESVFAIYPYRGSCAGIVVGRHIGRTWRFTASTDSGCSAELRTDVTDVNGDGREDIIARYYTGDGQRRCDIYALKRGSLVELGHFDDTLFCDLTGDGVPEALSLSAMSFMFAGDHWLTIYKWNGRGYTDVSRRFPKQYDAVIRDLKRTLYRLRYTNAYGTKNDPASDPELFSDFYYYLGKAYEYRGLPDKARIQYAIAYRLKPDDEEKAKAFRRMWGK